MSAISKSPVLPNKCVLRLLLCLIPACASAQTSCDDELAEIDRRIASGDYPDMNVQLAKTMRDSFAGMCGMLDDATRARMMEGIEEVLPTRSAEEQQAIKDSKRATAEASRQARREAETQRRAPDSGLGKATGSGSSVASGFVNRSEDMLRFWIWDWDIHNGNARVLYETLPSRTQLGRPDWRTWVYVVEITPDGRIAQRVTTSKQAQENAALALRRGHDEVLLQRRTGPEGTPTTLERWSVANQTLLSSVPTPVAEFPQGERITWMPFRTPTTDGNVLFLSAYQPTSGAMTAAWYKATPEGGTLGTGSRPLDMAGFTELDVAAATNGGGVLPLMSLLGQETRLLTLGNDASGTVSPPLRGEVESLAVGGESVTMIRPAGSSHVALTKVTADRSLATPIHGHWLSWVGREEIEREVYINPLANDLNVDFVTFTTTSDGEIVLYGNSKEHTGTDYVVLLDRAGSPKATAAVKQPKNGKIEGLLADDSGVWLFGHGYPTDEFSRFRFWFERIDFK